MTDRHHIHAPIPRDPPSHPSGGGQYSSGEAVPPGAGDRCGGGLCRCRGGGRLTRRTPDRHLLGCLARRWREGARTRQRHLAPPGERGEASRVRETGEAARLPEAGEAGQGREAGEAAQGSEAPQGGKARRAAARDGERARPPRTLRPAREPPRRRSRRTARTRGSPRSPGRRAEGRLTRPAGPSGGFQELPTGRTPPWPAPPACAGAWRAALDGWRSPQAIPRFGHLVGHTHRRTIRMVPLGSARGGGGRSVCPDVQDSGIMGSMSRTAAQTSFGSTPRT